MKNIPKLRFLFSERGPVFKGQYKGLDKQCEFLRAAVDEQMNADALKRHLIEKKHNNLSHPIKMTYEGITNDEFKRHKIAKKSSIKPHVLWRWMREGAVKTRSGDILSLVCTAVKNTVSIDADCDQIASWIVDKNVDVYQLASRFGLQKIDADYVLSVDDASRRSFFPMPNYMFTFSSIDAIDNKHLSYGIYRVIRNEDDSECLLIIDRIIDVDCDSDTRSGIAFVKMYVKHKGNFRPDKLARYRGFMIRTISYRYFFLQGTGAYAPDFVTIITDIGETPPMLLSGVYTSVNIGGKRGVGTRDVEIKRISDEVNDDLIHGFKKSMFDIDDELF